MGWPDRLRQLSQHRHRPSHIFICHIRYVRHFYDRSQNSKSEKKTQSLERLTKIESTDTTPIYRDSLSDNPRCQTMIIELKQIKLNIYLTKWSASNKQLKTNLTDKFYTRDHQVQTTWDIWDPNRHGTGFSVSCKQCINLKSYIADSKSDSQVIKLKCSKSTSASKQNNQRRRLMFLFDLTER